MAKSLGPRKQPRTMRSPGRGAAEPRRRSEVERVAGQGATPVQDRVLTLRSSFPDAFVEGRVDFERLRAALGDVVDTSPERYTFSWAGRRDAIRLLQMPSRATLVSVPQESVNFDGTRHIFIEGDNLEALKLLYKSYYGRVKMIYIDPPYNTGNDFIYRDDYADPLSAYLAMTGQVDVSGNLLTSNPETSGRYHSAWLSMMYPRLFLGRQLLREDGVLFVSIDDHEIYNLRMILNEIFGEENFLATLVRKRRMATGMRDEPVSSDHEYVVAYARSIERVRLFGGLLDESSYPFEDAQGKYRSTDLTVGMTKEMRPKQYYALSNPKSGKEYTPPDGRVWRFQPSTMENHVRADNIIWPEDQPGAKLTRPRFKTRFQKGNEQTKPVSTWIERQESDEVDSETNVLSAGMNLEGTKELRDLLGAQVVEYPKPVSLLKALVTLGAGVNDIVLDFFAGSATTGHAVLDLNREDGGNRRFIMVELPEPTAEDSTARHASFATISDIGKERLRRVAGGLRSESEGKLDLDTRSSPEDLGFRVFKLAPSSFKLWKGSESAKPDEYAEQMAVFVDPLVEGWKLEDVMWEVAIKEGYSLSSSFERAFSSKEDTVWRVHDPDTGQAFLLCLDSKVSPATVRSLELSKETVLVCRDAALDDELAANLALQCRLKTI